MDEQFWDERYRGRERIWSGEPNGVLVTEVSGLPPGRALDVGCGEGADARWLARLGWRVTALEVSGGALRRAAELATAADVPREIRWAHGDLGTAPPEGVFDLVSAQYFPLLRRPGNPAVRGLLDAVAPGGTLLFVGHDLTGQTAHRQDAADYYHPAQLAELLDDGWTVLVNETRERTMPAPEGTQHTHDTVLRARRLG